MPTSHSAAILPQKGGPFAVGTRDTPEPGPNEILIEVKAVALNPVDHAQRDIGLPPVPIYPAVIGSDVAGLVVKVGSSVANGPAPGTRVLAFASAFYQNGSPDHGAFQEYTIAQAEAVTALPDALSFEQGAVFPLAVLTALTAWTTVGISLDTKFAARDKQAVLIWGGASSVGTFAIHTTPTYLKTLGADAVFDDKSGDVVAQIVAAVKKDGVKLHTAHCVVNGGLQPTLDVLKDTKGDAPAKVAHSPVLPPDHPTLGNAVITFNLPSMDEEVSSKHIKQCFHVWLQSCLKSGSVVPSPKIQVVEGGHEGLNPALDILKGGVSGTKIFVPLSWLDGSVTAT